jgi:hypothetical protein
MKRGIAAVLLSGLLAGGAARPAVAQAGKTQGPSAAVDVRGLTLQATPLLVARGGGLRRIVDVQVQLSRPAAGLVLYVECGAERAEVPVAQAATARNVVAEVEVPDAAEPIQCRVTAMVNGQSQSADVMLKPQRKWRVYLAASSHTDNGYTHVQPECAERHNRNIEVATELMQRYPEFKWNCEVAWQVENFLATRQGPPVQEFLRRAREGRLGVQALYVNVLTGLCSHEDFCRLTWYAYGLHQRYGIPYESAMIDDVPSCVAATPMVLANSGIRYFSNGVNLGRAYPVERMFAKSPCWWQGPDGSRVMMMWVHTFAYALRMGFHNDLTAARRHMIKELTEYEDRADYPYDAVFGNGASNDNWPLEPKLPGVVEAWNRRYAFPKIILCRNSEFFEYVERHFGDKLPVVRGSGGTYWEDGAGTSARETTMCRNAQEAIDSAARLLALSTRLRPGSAYPRREIDDAWRNCLLYDEHTWGAHTAGTAPESEFTKAQWAIKSRFGHEAQRQSVALVDQAARSMVSLVRTTGDSLVVLNPTSWPRTDLLDVALPPGQAVVDPSASSCRVGERTLVAVRDVPACGYRVLHCQPAAAVQSAAPLAGTTLESRYYRVTFDPQQGTIVSLVDKELGRELVDRHAPYRLNQYLYVSGGKQSRIVDLDKWTRAPELSVAAPQKAVLHRVGLGALGQRMIVETSAPMTPRLTSEITVWEDVKRIDVVNHLTKTLTYEKEAAYFAFPFAAGKPVLRYEEPLAIVRPDKDFLPGACLDWLTVQHFVELDAGDAAICWSTPDAPLVTAHDINRGKWQTEYLPANGHLYGYVMNNYWFTNYLAGQRGEFAFRFAITSRPKADNAASARFGWGVASPMQAVTAGANPDGSLPGDSAGLLTIREPNVLLVGMKRADSGAGLVLRLWEVSGRATTAHVQLPGVPFTSARRCSLVEEPQQSLEVRQSAVAVPIRGSGVATVLVE